MGNDPSFSGLARFFFSPVAVGEAVRRPCLRVKQTTATNESYQALPFVHIGATIASSYIDVLTAIVLTRRGRCNQCGHHHPFERWSQQDDCAFAGFFTGVGRKGAPTGGQKIFSQAGSDLKHPRTGQAVAPAGFAAEPADLSGTADRRVALADWMTSPQNPFFARMIANRLWAHYFGRGLVEPIDDMRTTNPATNEPLLDALAAHLVELKFDLKFFTRMLLNSRVYQLESRPNEANKMDQQNFSHAAWKPMPADVLLDVICQATGVPEQFNGWPEGYRAIQIWDNRMPSYFFRIFGRPQRVSVCECERGNEPSIAQALHLMNSTETDIVTSMQRTANALAKTCDLQGSIRQPT